MFGLFKTYKRLLQTNFDKRKYEYCQDDNIKYSYKIVNRNLIAMRLLMISIILSFLLVGKFNSILIPTLGIILLVLNYIKNSSMTLLNKLDNIKIIYDKSHKG